MAAEILTLILGLVVGGLVVWFVARARIQYAADKIKSEAETTRVALAERLEAKEEQIQGLIGSLDKANEEIKILRTELKSDSEKRAAASPRTDGIAGLQGRSTRHTYQNRVAYSKARSRGVNLPASFPSQGCR